MHSTFLDGMRRLRRVQERQFALSKLPPMARCQEPA